MLPRGGINMAWRPAKSLIQLRDQINKLAPNRSKASDGTIGDASHQSRDSDHNPWVQDGGVGVVTALDITHDPGNGCDCEQIVQSLLNSRDTRIKYIIWNHRIVSSTVQPWLWRRYTGSNPHTKHFHLSVKADKVHYDSQKDWKIDNFVGLFRTLELDSPRMRGGDVRMVQQKLFELGYLASQDDVDSIYGSDTETAVKTFQTDRGIKVDGVVGATTYRELGIA
jgi:Putative peptidoglycan binding domain